MGRSLERGFQGCPILRREWNDKIALEGLQTFSRYSTALSGLLYAARIARSIWDLSKPMFSISAIAEARCWPIAKALGSLKLVPSVLVALNAGVGVDGAFAAPVLGTAAAAGAGGGAGVAPPAGAGVEGALAGVDDEAVEAAGAVFGYRELSTVLVLLRLTNRTLLTMHTMKPFSSILYDSTVCASLRTLPVWMVSDCFPFSRALEMQ